MNQIQKRFSEREENFLKTIKAQHAEIEKLEHDIVSLKSQLKLKQEDNILLFNENQQLKEKLGLPGYTP